MSKEHNFEVGEKVRALNNVEGVIDKIVGNDIRVVTQRGGYVWFAPQTLRIID